jgi:hypothetical protein
MDDMLSSIDYRRARLLLLVAGFGVLAVVVGIMLARRVETPEVLATVFFIGIFVSFMFWGVKGGLAAAVLASVAYVYARYPAIDVVGFDRFSGVIASRIFAFLAFGVLGGWANRQLEGSLTKLELYDQIDDETGLFNARFFLQDTDLELSRADRYRTIFSVAIAEFPDSALEGMPRRSRSVALKGLGRMIHEALRTVDRAAVGHSDGRFRLAVILPETGREGAQVFVNRLVDRVASFLAEKGAPISVSDIKPATITLPEEREALDRLCDTFRAIDRVEHPEAATNAATS